jgi:hypothetical protein
LAQNTATKEALHEFIDFTAYIVQKIGIRRNTDVQEIHKITRYYSKKWVVYFFFIRGI